MLTITDLVKVYPTGTSALNGVSLTVDEPQVVTVIGPSGAGKSTLIRCINRLVEPSSGRVVLDGTDITGLGRRALRKARRRMGMIFQEYNLVERLTVMENVLSGRLGYVGFLRAYRRNFPPEDVTAAFELLDRVGLAGYENTRADALSGGQRQRVGISRALMQRPDLLLVDEPTASLDPKTSRQIMRILVELAHERGSGVYGLRQSGQLRRARRCWMTHNRASASDDASSFRSRRRGTTATASLVCRVLKTKCPVMAARMQEIAVSSSRISPTRMMSGSLRRKRRVYSANVLPMKTFTWYWVTPSRWYSTGSSAVTIFLSPVFR